MSPFPSPASSTAAASRTATPSIRAAPDWNALASTIRGELIRPADARYDQARVLYNTRFDAVRPQAVARCANADDVKACVRFARGSGVPLAIRSGGHSYAGWSTGTGLVIDVSPLSSIDVAGGEVTVGAGTRLVDLYDAVARRGAGIAAGSCPTVGITGLALGGGVGVMARQWGLTCDDLIAARIVTADAQLRDCDATEDPDLFWALRGGGGGSFGVVTSLTLRTHPARDLALGYVTWPASRAAAAVGGWSAWMSAAPEALWSTLHLDVSPDGPTVAVHTVFAGSDRDLNGSLDDLARRIGDRPEYREAGTRAYRDVMLLEAGCLGRTVAQCHLRDTTPEGQLDRETYAAKSIVVPRPLSPEAVNALVEGMRSAPGGSVLLDALGGAVGRLASDATAFPHRGAFAIVQLIGSWDASSDGATTITWLRKTHATLRPLIGRGAYVNYIDPDLDDWPDAFWGANYPRLRAVKARYDPDRVFDFPQAVRP